MGAEKTVIRGDTQNGPSGQIWHDCPIADIARDPSIGFGFYDDFLRYGDTATTVANASGTPTYDGSSTVKGRAAAGGGLALFSTDDNEEAGLGSGGATSGPFMIPAAKSGGKKLWFEARVKKSLITNNAAGLFVGLTSPGAIVASFMAATDFSDVDILGFWIPESYAGDATDGANIHVVTQKTSAAFDYIIEEADTHAEADTFLKLGFKYDPKHPENKLIRFYIDNVEQSTFVAELAADSTVYTADATNFPGGEQMAPGFAMEVGSSNDFTATMAWWRAYQLY